MQSSRSSKKTGKKPLAKYAFSFQTGNIVSQSTIDINKTVGYFMMNGPFDLFTVHTHRDRRDDTVVSIERFNSYKTEIEKGINPFF